MSGPCSANSSWPAAISPVCTVPVWRRYASTSGGSSSRGRLVILDEHPEQRADFLHLLTFEDLGDDGRRLRGHPCRACRSATRRSSDRSRQPLRAAFSGTMVADACPRVGARRWPPEHVVMNLLEPFVPRLLARRADIKARSVHRGKSRGNHRPDEPVAHEPSYSSLATIEGARHRSDSRASACARLLRPPTMRPRGVPLRMVVRTQSAACDLVLTVPTHV